MTAGKDIKVTKVTNITGIFLVIHIWFWALHYQDYWNSLTFFFVIAQIWHISILMISYPHYLNYSFLSFLELKKYHLSYQITQITKIVNLFQEQNDKIVTIVTNIIHRFFSFWKKLAHIEPCLFSSIRVQFIEFCQVKPKRVFHELKNQFDPIFKSLSMISITYHNGPWGFRFLCLVARLLKEFQKV